MSKVPTEWPVGGPANWVARWKDLVSRAEKYDAVLGDWLGDFCHVREKVPKMENQISTIQTAAQEEIVDKYSHGKRVGLVVEGWEDRKRGLALRSTKPRATGSAFATQEGSFNGDETTGDAPEPTETADTNHRREAKI